MKISGYDFKRWFDATLPSIDNEQAAIFDDEGKIIVADDEILEDTKLGEVIFHDQRPEPVWRLIRPWIRDNKMKTMVVAFPVGRQDFISEAIRSAGATVLLA